MTIISLSFREESETITHDSSDNINDTNVSDIRTDEVTETTSSNEVGFEELRNYDTQPTATIEVINFEDLKLSINELITTELATQSKLDELILQQQYNNTLSMYSIIGLASLFVVMIFYKLLMIGFSRY